MSKAKLVDDGEDILFNFGKGNTLTLEDVSVKSLTAEHFGFKATSGAVVLPTSKNDKLSGTVGNDTLDGGSGSDTFVFSTGITEIEDFKAGTDKVEISKSLGVSTFSDLMTLATVVDGGEDVRIDFGSATLTFDDTSIAQLKSSDFFFV